MDFQAYPDLVSEIIITQRPDYPYLQMLRQHFGSGKIMINFLEWQKNQQMAVNAVAEQARADAAREMSEIYGGDWTCRDPPYIQIFDICFGGIKEMTGEYNDELEQEEREQEEKRRLAKMTPEELEAMMAAREAARQAWADGSVVFGQAR